MGDGRGRAMLLGWKLLEPLSVFLSLSFFFSFCFILFLVFVFSALNPETACGRFSY